MNRILISIVFVGIFSCQKSTQNFSFLPVESEKPLLVSELGESLDIIEIQTKYPISGIPTILKSTKFFYLFERGVVTSLHQVSLEGKALKSIDFGYDDKLNSDAITQVYLDGERIGVVSRGHLITWFDENLEETGTETLPVKAKFHFQLGNQTIAHTNGLNDDNWDIFIYDSIQRSSHLPISKERYNFFNESFSPFSDWNEKVVFSQAFNDTIYIWDKDQFQPLFRVNFNSQRVTEERYLQIQNSLDMLAFFNEKKYSFIQGEIYGLDGDRILFQVNEKGKQKLALMDFGNEELTLYPGLIDNSISGLNLYDPQFSNEGVLYFGVSGEQILENYDRIPDSFKNRLSEDYAESYFIYLLKIKEK